MHEPEHWGLLQFALPDPLNGTAPEFYDQWPVRSVAMAVYWAQRLARDADPAGLYAPDLASLAPFAPPGLLDGTCTAPPELAVSADRSSWTVVVEAVVPGTAERLTAQLNHLRLLTVTRGDGDASARPAAVAAAAAKTDDGASMDVVATTVAVDVSSAAATSPFPHFWEEIFGSAHGALTLRRDWQRAAT